MPQRVVPGADQRTTAPGSTVGESEGVGVVAVFFVADFFVSASAATHKKTAITATARARIAAMKFKNRALPPASCLLPSAVCASSFDTIPAPKRTTEAS